MVPVALRPGGTSSAAAATLGNGGFGEGVLVERARERDETQRGERREETGGAPHEDESA